LLEATIDFADEDVPVDVTPEVSALLNTVNSELTAEIASAKTAERIRDGFEVAIVGPPNAGKSTLLNALAGREAAITSEFAGTTRDVIEVHMDLGGLPVTILDTAGLRDSDDAVESIGIARAKERAGRADLRVFLTGKGTEPLGFEPLNGDIVVQGKSDLISDQGQGVSGLTGQGVSQLIDNITLKLTNLIGSPGIAIRERHRNAMVRASQCLDSALIEVLNGPDRAEFAAEEIRTGIRALDSLVGRVDVENILDEIFSSFCLGK
jgi:tRNA modification GTPase